MSNTAIAIDFDGTIAEHRYPDIGKPVPGAFKWMKEFQKLGAKLLLYTMRCDSSGEGPVLTDAINFCKANGIIFDGINTNPGQRSWSCSPKCHAQIFIDDHGVFIPLIQPISGRAYVDWEKVGPECVRIINDRNKGV
jgi:hypothetical protein